MRKIAVIIVSYLALAFGACVGMAHLTGDLPALLDGARGGYLFFSGVQLFFRLLPALLCSGFLVAASISFGRSEAVVRTRFSPQMAAHYRKVMLASLCMVFVLAMAKEVGVPSVDARQKQAAAAPYLLNEYVTLGEQYLAKGDAELAHEYATFALRLAPNNAAATALVERSETRMQQIASEEPEPVAVEEGRGFASEEVMNETVLSLLKKSRAAAADGNWFHAHYYAQLALSFGSERDITFAEAQQLAAEAWNRLSNPHAPQENDTWRLYDKKRRAYDALMNGDNLDAYYRFKELADAVPYHEIDPDVKNFLQIALARLEAECFFIDETLNMQRFESAQNVYFTIRHSDGKTDVVFISGMTRVRNTGGMLTYLRGFTMYTYSAEGALLRTVSTPYAKMLAQPVASYSERAKRDYDINDSYELVPTLQLKSVQRDTRGEVNAPEYHFAGSVPLLERKQSNVLVLAMPIDDFALACEASLGADKMSLPALFKIHVSAADFGYASEIFGAALVRRLLYPLVMLLLFLFCASFAWNYRLAPEQVFKFKWIFVLPFATLLLFLLIEILLFVSDLLCYALIAVVGNALLPTAVVLCLLLLIVLSVTFLSRTTV